VSRPGSLARSIQPAALLWLALVAVGACTESDRGTAVDVASTPTEVSVGQPADRPAGPGHDHPRSVAELRSRPLPPSPRGIADQVEWLILAHLEREPEALTLARQRAAVLAEQYPQYYFGTFLHAYAAELAGQGETAAAVVAAMDPDVAAVYRYFFGQPQDEITATIRCHLIKSCLRRATGGAQPKPNGGPFEFVGQQTAPPDGPALDEPATCGSMTVDPASCPDSFAVFERVASEHYSSDRLQRWNADQLPLTPEQFAGRLGLAPGQRVADIGAGMGYFSIPFAHVVGETGRVHAVEIDQAMVTFIDTIARERGIDQLDGVLSRPGDVTLPPNSIDMAFLCAMFKDLLLEDRALAGTGQPGAVEPFLASIHQALAPGGTLVIVDHASTDEHEDPKLIELAELTGIVQGACFAPLPSLDDFLPMYHVLRFERVDCAAVRATSGRGSVD
jgi:predicted methyltransferase